MSSITNGKFDICLKNINNFFLQGYLTNNC